MVGPSSINRSVLVSPTNWLMRILVRIPSPRSFIGATRANSVTIVTIIKR